TMSQGQHGMSVNGAVRRQLSRMPVPDDTPFLKFWKQENNTLPETIGKANLSTLNSALGFLFNRLREARKQFEQEVDNGRQGACTALSAFWQFITLFEKLLCMSRS